MGTTNENQVFPSFQIIWELMRMYDWDLRFPMPTFTLVMMAWNCWSRTGRSPGIDCPICFRCLLISLLNYCTLEGKCSVRKIDCFHFPSWFLPNSPLNCTIFFWKWRLQPRHLYLCVRFPGDIFESVPDHQPLSALTSDRPRIANKRPPSKEFLRASGVSWKTLLSGMKAECRFRRRLSLSRETFLFFLFLLCSNSCAALCISWGRKEVEKVSLLMSEKGRSKNDSSLFRLGLCLN